MDNKTFSQLLTLAVGVVLALVILEILMVPLLGILEVVLVALILLLLYRRWPKMHDAVDEIIAKLRHKTSKLTEGGSTLIDTTFHPEYCIKYNANGRPKQKLINKELYVIGRGTDCDLFIDDGSVTTKHCQIIYRKYSREYYIEDLNSKNGTFLGTHHLEPYTQEKLLDGTEIIISGQKYLFTRIIVAPEQN